MKIKDPVGFQKSFAVRNQVRSDLFLNPRRIRRLLSSSDTPLYGDLFDLISVSRPTLFYFFLG